MKVAERSEPQDFVVCRVCDREFLELAGHLRAHRMKGAGYRERFPGAPLISEEARVVKSRGMTGVPHLKARGVKRPEHGEKMRGDRNPAKRPEVRKKLRENNAMHDPVHRASVSRALTGMPHPWAQGDNNWMRKNPELAKAHGLKRRGIPHPWMVGDKNWMCSPEGRKWFSENNPMHDSETVQKQVKSAKPTQDQYRKDHPEEMVARCLHMRRFSQMNKDSYLERKVHSLLHKHRISHVRWPRIELSYQDGVKFIKELDFFLPDHFLYIEADGCYWHGCLACCPRATSNPQIAVGVAKDKIVDEAFAQGGEYRLFRFWGHDIRKRLGWVERKLLEEVQVRSQP